MVRVGLLSVTIPVLINIGDLALVAFAWDTMWICITALFMHNKTSWGTLSSFHIPHDAP